MFSRAPDPRGILQRKHERRSPLDYAERQGISPCHLRYGFNHGRGERNSDQNDQGSIESSTYATRAIVLLKNGVDAPTESFAAGFGLRSNIRSGGQCDISVGTVMD